MARHRGFTLLEMSIVLVIIALVIGGSISIFTGSLLKKQYDETNARLNVIEKAMLDFRRTYDRLPCPGDLTATITSNNFGAEAAKATAATASCHGSSPAANYFAGAPIEAGLLPVKALKLPDDYAFDSWGRRFIYAVDNRATVAAAFTSAIPVTDTTTRIIVADENGNVKLSNALYAVITSGPSGHGMYSTDGQTRIAAAISNAFILKNCDCDTNGAITDTYKFSSFTQSRITEDAADSTASFGGLVRAHSRQEMRTGSE